MVKVKVVNKDNTNSVYDVTYPRAYVQKIIDEENLKGDDRKVKEIYVNDNMVARLISNDLVHYCNTSYEAKLQPKVESPSNERSVVTIEIPGNSYWVSTSTAGNTLVSYVAETVSKDDLPF